MGELVVVTGMTGAGRSTAAKELEDLGFYVVDNLPPTLLPDVVRLVDETRGTAQRIAVVVDVRSGSFFDELRETLCGRAHQARFAHHHHAHALAGGDPFRAGHVVRGAHGVRAHLA